MRGRSKTDLLKRIPLFADCSRDELETIARVTTELSLPEGRELMRQGDRGRELVVILDGEAAIERDGERIAVGQAGDFFGEIALVTGRPRTATVTATSGLRVLVLDGLAFDRLLKDVPSISVKVLKALGERLPPDEGE